jgi:hypothetical protein
MLMRSALFWDVTPPRVVIVYRRLGTFRSHLEGSRIVKMERTRCPETSVNNYHTTPSNIPEERSSLTDLVVVGGITYVHVNLNFTALLTKAPLGYFLPLVPCIFGLS